MLEKRRSRRPLSSSGCATTLETVEAGYVKKCKNLILA
jgi:hypothetical protein